MDIPKNIQVKAIQDSLTSQKLYLFKNKTYSNTAPAHYHLAIKTNNDNYILLTMLTSQVEKKKIFYEDSPSLLSSLIQISASNITKISPRLHLDSCIDCNRPILKTNEELLANIAENSFEYIDACIENSLIVEIIDAIKSSPQVRPNIKNTIL